MVARLGPRPTACTSCSRSARRPCSPTTRAGDWPDRPSGRPRSPGSAEAARSPLGLTAAAFAALARGALRRSVQPPRRLAQIVPDRRPTRSSTYMWNGVVNISATVGLGAGPTLALGRPFLSPGRASPSRPASARDRSGRAELTLARMVPLGRGPGRGRAGLRPRAGRRWRPIDGCRCARSSTTTKDWGCCGPATRSGERAAALLDDAAAGFAALGMAEGSPARARPGRTSSARDATGPIQHGLTSARGRGCCACSPSAGATGRSPSGW